MQKFYKITFWFLFSFFLMSTSFPQTAVLGKLLRIFISSSIGDVTGHKFQTFKWDDLEPYPAGILDRRDLTVNAAWVPGVCEYGTGFHFIYKVYIYKNNQLIYISSWLFYPWSHTVTNLLPYDIIKVDVVFQTIPGCMGNILNHASVFVYDTWSPIYLPKVSSNSITPPQYLLSQNYPNPFNPSTEINFSLAVDSKVSLRVFDVLGQEVANLVNTDLVAGAHNVVFDASSLNSGVYFYRIEATGIDGTNFMNVKKMLMLK